MSQDEVEQILPGWQVASQAVARELAEWRRAHPKATLAEIEDAVYEAIQQLQAWALGQVVHASGVTDVAAQPSDERPLARRVVVNWSHAGVNDAGFGPRGNVHTWTWTVATRYAPRAEPVSFPLDEELELLAGELSATLAEGVARLGSNLPFDLE